MTEKEIDYIEIIERYLILLLGVVDRAIPTPLHIQKEMFALSQANPKIGEFIFFDKHYKGPYSADLDDIAKNPAYHIDAYGLDRSYRLHMTPKGKKIYDKIIKEHGDDPSFKELLGIMKMIREIYDKLSKDELLFLIYVTYDEYTQKSSVSENLLSQERRVKLASSLLKKGVISEKRFKELVEAV